jgi:glycosyltransferase involved in cell wall biosynthesis
MFRSRCRDCRSHGAICRERVPHLNTPVIEDLVSTVIPVYNRAAMLREAVDSVLAQTWRPIEIIIVDDGSTDDTLAVEAELCQRHPGIVRVLAQSNAGPGVARELGLQAARGEFVQFLDSDDLLLPQKFETQIAGLRNDAEAGIAYSKSYASQRGVRASMPAQRTGEHFRTLFPALLQEPLWPTMTPLYRRAVLDRVGAWPRKRQLEDWEYDAQAAALGVKLHYDDVYLSETRDHGEARLCHQWRSDANALRDRVSAFLEVLGHAQRAGLARELPEMQRFARSLFWMARIAGARGLTAEAQALFDRARALSLRPGWDFRLFALAVALLGWRRSSRWSEHLLARTS